MSEATPDAAQAQSPREGVGQAVAAAVRAHFGFAALLAILFLTFLDNTIASAVLTSVQSELHANVSQLQWVVGGYALAFASLMLMCGSLGDNFGRKRVMLIGVVIFCAGSVVCAVAVNPSELVIGRVVMGVGAAASEPGTLSMIRHLFPDRRVRARALGTWAAVSGLALAMGPVIGGVLVGIWSWRAVFWFNVVFGVAALVVASVALRESVNPVRRPVDYAGFFLGAVVLGLATFATIQGELSGYATPWVISLYVVSFLTVPIFIFAEHRAMSPMLEMSFFRRRSFTGSAFIAFASYFSVFSIFFFVALYLEVVANTSAYGLALDFLPLLAGIVVASFFTGSWVGRVGSRVPMMTGCLVAAAGVFLTQMVIGPGVDVSKLGWTMGIAGIGFGIVIAPVNATALSSLPASRSGMASSAVNTSRELGAVAGVAILGSIVNGQLTVNLTARLVQLGVPRSYRNEIITAVTTGSTASEASSVGKHASAFVKEMINKVVNAAYGALTHGLNIALVTSGLLLLVAAVVAYYTGTRERQGMIELDDPAG